MKIKAREKPDTIDTVLAREAEFGFGDVISCTIAETYSDPKRLKDFGFSDAVQGRAMALAEGAKDEDPEFVVVRTEEGWSRSGRLYEGAILDSIAEQVNAKQPVAHLGHIPDHEIATAFPEPQTTWVGAITKSEPSTLKERIGKIVKVIYTAGYNLPGAKVRTYLKTGAVNSTSWQGVAEQTPIPGKGVKVLTFNLHSLDWARKLSEGMETARVVALAKEMSTNGGHKVDGEKDLAQVTPEEFKEANPNGYRVLVSEATAEKDKTISEMQQEIDAAKADKSLLDEIRQTLKLNEDANPLEQIAHLVKRLGEKAKASVDEALDAVLAEKVPDEERRKLIRRLMPVAEMQTKAEDAKDGEEVKTLVSEMVTETFDKDDVVQSLVSEQTPPIVRRREDLSRSGGEPTLDKAIEKTGMTRERQMMRS